MQIKVDRAGLQTIAIFEALKGSIVLLAAAGLISLVHKDAQAAAEEIVEQFHLNPASHYPHIFLDAVASLTSGKLWLLAAGALLYAAIRFVEAYGLWHERTWAEWLGAVSGSLYVPIEIYELLKGINLLKFVLFLINGAVVIYLAHTLINPDLFGSFFVKIIPSLKLRREDTAFERNPTIF